MIEFPSLSGGERRLVFRREDGLFAIFGISTVQPPDMIEGSDSVACLVAVKPRYYLYKPLTVPDAPRRGTLHEGQR